MCRLLNVFVNNSEMTCMTIATRLRQYRRLNPQPLFTVEQMRSSNRLPYNASQALLGLRRPPALRPAPGVGPRSRTRALQPHDLVRVRPAKVARHRAPVLPYHCAQARHLGLARDRSRATLFQLAAWAAQFLSSLLRWPGSHGLERRVVGPGTAAAAAAAVRRPGLEQRAEDEQASHDDGRVLLHLEHEDGPEGVGVGAGGGAVRADQVDGDDENGEAEQEAHAELLPEVQPHAPQEEDGDGDDEGVGDDVRDNAVDEDGVKGGVEGGRVSAVDWRLGQR